MTSTNALPLGDRRELAAAKAAERRARVRRIRHLTAAGAAAAFLAAFGGLYAQMHAGNDPALGQTASTATETESESSTSTDDSSLSDVAPVTTGQS